MMNLRLFLPLHVFKYLQEGNWLGQWLDTTPLIFPVFATAHLIGLAILLGSTLIVDLRLMGYGMKKQSAADLIGYLEPWIIVSLLIMLVSGVPMFMSEAVKASAISAVFYKLVLLTLAVIIHFTIYRKTIKAGIPEGSGAAWAIGCLSLLLWLSVALAGRAIGFLYVLDPGATLQ
jgi:hypothetical protein